MLLLLALACSPSMKELEAQNAALAAELAALEARVADLEGAGDSVDRRVSALEARTGDGEVHGSGRDAQQPQCAAVDADRFAYPHLADGDLITRSARAFPHKRADGEQDGLRVSAIRPGSFLESCGLKNGDIVHAVADVALVETSAVLEAWRAVEREGSFSMRITRRNKPLELHFQPAEAGGATD